MYENLRSLKFDGAAFPAQTSLKLFDKPSCRICLIYGKNGSGKSTISKAFLKLSGMERLEINAASLEDDSGNAIPIPALDQRNGIFVFNEDYIQEKVRIKEDGLGTIVMFGQQAELDELIEQASAEYAAAVAEKERVAAEAKPFEDPKNVVSPHYYIAKMTSELSGDDHWSGRERLISASRRNASVSNTAYQTIIKQKPNRSLEEVKSLYQQKYELLRKARTGNAEIKTSAIISIKVPDNEDIARELLAKVLEKPELTEREQYLLSLLEQGNVQYVEEMHRVFLEPGTKRCPFCYQETSDECKAVIVQSVETVLSKAVDEHKVALSALKISLIDFDFSPFQLLDGAVLKVCETAFQNLNNAIMRLNDALDKKIGNPYTAIVLESLDLSTKSKAFLDALNELEKARTTYNAPFSNILELQKALKQLNGELAYYEIEDAFKEFLKQTEEKKKADAVLLEKRRIEEVSKKKLEDLQLKRRSVKIAINKINESLRYVFFSTKRLEVESDETGAIYTLKSNGMNVRPADISAGERNILALCYFFIEMLDNTEVANAFATESLVVIDDPISSFDHENRIGIMSLLRRNMERILIGNNASKIILMTHDLQAAFDIEKANEEICKAISGQGNNKYSAGIFELCDRELKDFRYKKRHEYSDLLAAVFQYGQTASIENEDVIGNIMRRSLEAFSTFVYRKGIAEISLSDEILATMGDTHYVEYFKHLMYRLVLNSESHTEERVRTLMDDNDFVEMLSPSEKQRTARDIICFIYLLNPQHVIAHLTNANVTGFETVIDGWCKEILSFAGEEI